MKRRFNCRYLLLVLVLLLIGFLLTPSSMTPRFDADELTAIKRSMRENSEFSKTTITRKFGARRQKIDDDDDAGEHVVVVPQRNLPKKSSSSSNTISNSNSNTASSKIPRKDSSVKNPQNSTVKKLNPPPQPAPAASQVDIVADSPPGSFDVADFPPPPLDAIPPNTPTISGYDLASFIENNLFTKSYLMKKRVLNKKSPSPTPQEINTTISPTTTTTTPGKATTTKKDKPLIFGERAWEAISCLSRSTLHCLNFEHHGGPLPELSKLSKKDDRDEAWCCAFADRGRWKKPFDADAFEILSKTTVNPRKLLSRLFSRFSEDDTQTAELLSKIGETGEAQEFIEEIFSTLSASRKMSLIQTKMMLLLGLSRLKKVPIEVSEPGELSSESETTTRKTTNGTNNITTKKISPRQIKTQKVVRVFLFGNSFVRALIANFAAIMRGQERYFERASRQTIRYTVTNLGDYFWFSSTMPKTKNPVTGDIKNATEPIIDVFELRKKNEQVFFEIMFEFSNGLWYRFGRPKIFGVDFMKMPVIENKNILYRGDFSAIFVRWMVVRKISAYTENYGIEALDKYSKWQMETLMKVPTPSASLSNSSDLKQKNDTNDNNPNEDDDDYYVALHQAPNAQYPEDMSSSATTARYERVFGRFNFEAARDQIAANSTRTTTTTAKTSPRARHLILDPPPREKFNIVDDHHSQCILLPHYPAMSTRFRTEDRNDEKCCDLLSRAYIMKFSFGAFYSAKSTKAFFSKRKK